MPDRVVEQQQLPLFPRSNFVGDPNPTQGFARLAGNDERQVTTQDAVKRPAVRRDVHPRMQNRKERRRDVGDPGDQLRCPGTPLAVLLDEVSVSAKHEDLPTHLPEHLLAWRQVTERRKLIGLELHERVQLGADFQPMLFQFHRPGNRCRIVKRFRLEEKGKKHTVTARDRRE